MPIALGGLVPLRLWITCVNCFVWQVRDTAHREAREAEVVATDAEQLRTDAEDTQDMVQMAVDAAESK